MLMVKVPLVLVQGAERHGEESRSLRLDFYMPTFKDIQPEHWNLSARTSESWSILIVEYATNGYAT